MINTGMRSRNAVLKDTINMLFDLNVRDLLEIQAYIKGNCAETTKDNADVGAVDYYKPLSEVELIAQIDEAVAQADSGMLIDSEVMEKELISEFGL